MVEPLFREQRFDNNNPGPKARPEDHLDGGRNSERTRPTPASDLPSLEEGTEAMTEPKTASFESTKEGVPMNHRRGVPRHPALWDGTCSIERESTGPRSCRVVDISIFGLGITLEHPSPSQLVGRRISVEVPMTDDSASIYTAGTITNAGPTLGGAVRVGIKFDGFLLNRTRSSPCPEQTSSSNESTHPWATGQWPGTTLNARVHERRRVRLIQSLDQGTGAKRDDGHGQ
jgi:PilZ domain